MKYLFLVGIFCVAIAGEVALAVEKKEVGSGDRQNVSSDISKEQKEKMALMHETMAACLRSEKTIQDCRAEMRGQCLATMGKGDCPFFDQKNGMMGPGMRKQRAHWQNQDVKPSE